MKSGLLKSIILTGALLLSTTTAFASTFTDTKNGWYLNRDTQGWQYYQNNQLAHDGLLQDNNKLYYMDSKGNMITGWINYGNYKMYTNNDGSIIDSGWRYIGGQWYYFCHGVMLTGSVNLEGKEYNLASDGHWIE